MRNVTFFDVPEGSDQQNRVLAVGVMVSGFDLGAFGRTAKYHES